MTRDRRISGVLLQVWGRAEPYFRVTLPRFKRGFLRKNRPWRIAPDDKTQPVHVFASTRQSLVAVFPKAIAIGAPAGSGKKFIGLLSIVALSMSVTFLYFSFKALIFFGLIVYFIFGCVLGSFFLNVAIWMLKVWLCTPRDWPIVFNRVTRKVTFSPITTPSFWKFWSFKVKQQYLTGSWDDAGVRSYRHMESYAGQSFHDSYILGLLWGGEGGDPRVVSQAIAIGYQGYFEDELLWMLWEHIRRYMEEGGPPIRQGETLRARAWGRPIEYPLEVIEAAGGPPLTESEIERLSEAAPAQ